MMVMIAFDHTTPLKTHKYQTAIAPVSLTPALAGLAGRRQPTPAFPQPKAPILRLPASYRQTSAPNRPVPAVNNGGYFANQVFITRVP
ncbi:MAG: hypothetical protein JNJ78_00065 [Anaerolineae bacterium]|nr:hypothetical protein [Anaerolineae bacterium]